MALLVLLRFVKPRLKRRVSLGRELSLLAQAAAASGFDCVYRTDSQLPRL